MRSDFSFKQAPQFCTAWGLVPLYRLPVAAELFCGCFEVTVPKFAILAASKEVTNHAAFSKSVKFLRFGPWGALPTADMPQQKMGRLLTGGSK